MGAVAVNMFDMDNALQAHPVFLSFKDRHGTGCYGALREHLPEVFDGIGTMDGILNGDVVHDWRGVWV